jgi:hypothetical protein
MLPEECWLSRVADYKLIGSFGNNATTSPVVVKQVGLITAGSGAGSVSHGITINVGSGTCQ